MTLREEIYHQLRSAGLVSCAEDFSQRYLTRNRNWYAHQRFHGRDFSIGSALACLRSIHAQQRDLTLASAQLLALTATAGLLQNHLFTTYGITDVA